MNKQFIPYEQALALKELGFTRPCLAGYGKKAEFIFKVHLALDLEMTEDLLENFNQFKGTYYQISAPLWQQAFDWFREKHNLFGSVLSIGERSYEWRIQNIKYLQDRRHFTLADIGGGEIDNTYEEAQLECLIKLIELCTKK